MVIGQWITIFIQLIYLTNISADCNIEQINQYYGYQSVTCTRVEINTEMFSEFNIHNLQQVSIIDIEESTTKLINPGKFHVMHNLKIINIRNSEISEITKGVFSGFHFLTTLDISANKISKIESNSFSELNKLNLLNISRNYLQSIDFFGDGSECILTILDLSYNKISAIADQFTRLTELRILNLTGNLIKNFDEGSFSNLNRLETLNLAGNQINKIPVGIFKDMRSLNFLNLSNNRIDSMPLGTFAGLTSLDTIDLSFNEIKSCSADMLHDLNSLSAFYINNNFISNLNAGRLLDNLPVLRFISLHGNNWSCYKLSDIIRSLRSKKITLRLGENFREKNINGIKCSGEIDNETTRQTVNPNGNQSFGVDLEKLKRYFASDFKQSEFYQFFDNKFFKEFEDSFKDAHFFKHVDDDFLNSKFYKYFTEGYINATFFEFLDKKIEEMQTLREGVQLNKTDYEEMIKKTFTEYFSSLKPSSDHLRDTSGEEVTNNTILRALNKLVTALLFVLLLIWITLSVVACKLFKINARVDFAKFFKSRSFEDERQNHENQLM